METVRKELKEPCQHYAQIKHIADYIKNKQTNS